MIFSRGAGDLPLVYSLLVGGLTCVWQGQNNSKWSQHPQGDRRLEDGAFHSWKAVSWVAGPPLTLAASECGRASATPAGGEPHQSGVRVGPGSAGPPRKVVVLALVDRA